MCVLVYRCVLNPCTYGSISILAHCVVLVPTAKFLSQTRCIEIRTPALLSLFLNVLHWFLSPWYVLSLEDCIYSVSLVAIDDYAWWSAQTTTKATAPRPFFLQSQKPEEELQMRTWTACDLIHVLWSCITVPSHSLMTVLLEATVRPLTPKQWAQKEGGRQAEMQWWRGWLLHFPTFSQHCSSCSPSLPSVNGSRVPWWNTAALYPRLFFSLSISVSRGWWEGFSSMSQRRARTVNEQ